MKVLVYGSRDFGKVVRHLVDDCGHTFCGYIDDHYDGDQIVGSFAEVRRMCAPSEDLGLVLAVGYRHLAARRKLLACIRDEGYRTPSLIHPKAYVASSAEIADANIVMATAVVDSCSRLGEMCVLWPGAVINHDSVLQCNCFVSPGAVVCGYANIGANTFIGANAVVVDHATVPDNTFVKACSRFVGATS